MKKILIFFFLSILSINCLFSQEWLTSIEVAKTLARIQNKMILAVWEDSAYESYPVLIKDSKEGFRVIELFGENEQNKVLWKYFVPVLIPENNYEDIIEDFELKRNLNYMKKFSDDTIKIMDANGNILNTDPSQYKFSYSNLTFILENYTLDTSFLKNELESYSQKRNFNTSYRLASKYLDFAILANKSLGIEIV
ncbi:MAG: hypothetical protein KJN66_09395, partial [Bacteroidia bacterium]|nr:hypothetical protein [Bacteroidia bacterium]